MASRRSSNREDCIKFTGGQSILIQAQKHSDAGQSNAFVVIAEAMIFDEAVPIGRGQLGNGGVIAVDEEVLRFGEGRFQGIVIEDASRAPFSKDELTVNGFSPASQPAGLVHLASSRKALQ